MAAIRQDSDNIRNKNRKSGGKLAFRILVLLGVCWTVFMHPEELATLEGMNFFRRLSPLHLLWALWLYYMVEKLLPLKWPKGCRKYRGAFFSPSGEYQENGKAGQRYTEEKRQADRGAGRVLAVWLFVALLLGVFRHICIQKGETEVCCAVFLLLSALFYIGDLICILFWCPFRTFWMKNRCCTQCRIYNWDSWMLILPILFIPGFYSYSLLAGALVVTGVWEGAYLRHPERFFPGSNASLQCRNCQGEPGCCQHRRKRKNGRP